MGSSVLPAVQSANSGNVGTYGDCGHRFKEVSDSKLFVVIGVAPDAGVQFRDRHCGYDDTVVIVDYEADCVRMASQEVDQNVGID